MRKVWFLFFMIINILSLYGEENTNKTTIKFEDYLNIIKEKLPEIKIYENALLKSENELFKSNSLYNVEIGGSFSGIGKKIYPDGSPIEVWYSSGFNGDGYVSTIIPSGTRLTFGAGYTQMYSTGYVTITDLLINQGHVMGTKEIETEFFSTTRDPVIRLGISQPLIYNWFGFLDRYSKKEAKMKFIVEQLKKIENENEIINYYKKVYFLWFQWRKILDYLGKTIENAKRLEVQTAEKLRSGIAENDEFQRVRYSVIKYEEQYKYIEMEYKNLINELKIFFDAESMEPEIKELDTYPIYLESEKNPIILVEFEKTRVSKIINLDKDNVELLKKVKFNQMFPQLNIFGNLDIKFHEYYYDPEGHNDSEIVYDFYKGNIDFTTGIEFKYTLGNFKTRAEFKEAELIFNDIILQYEITKNNYLKKINIIITNIGLLKDIIDKKNKNIESLNSRLRTERVKYAQARQIELRDLIETENLITSEEIELMKTKANIITLYLDYLKLIE